MIPYGRQEISEADIQAVVDVLRSDWLTQGPAVAAFEKLGFFVERIKGAHHNMKREGHPYVLTVPVHGNKPVAAGTLRALIRAAGITVQEFIGLL